jgi:hypothetical protein
METAAAGEWQTSIICVRVRGILNLWSIEAGFGDDADRARRLLGAYSPLSKRPADQAPACRH